MNLRFKVLGAAFAVLLLLAVNTDLRPFNNVADIFLGLAALLLLSIIALWPNPSRSDRVDRDLEGESWADRVDLEQLGRNAERPRS